MAGNLDIIMTNAIEIIDIEHAPGNAISDLIIKKQEQQKPIEIIQRKYPQDPSGIEYIKRPFCGLFLLHLNEDLRNQESAYDEEKIHSYVRSIKESCIPGINKMLHQNSNDTKASESVYLTIKVSRFRLRHTDELVAMTEKKRT
jgi:hypothetical protein